MTGVSKGEGERKKELGTVPAISNIWQIIFGKLKDETVGAVNTLDNKWK